MAAGNSEKDPLSPDQLSKLLELELQQKRETWQHEKRRLSAFRALSFLFLFLVIAGALAAWWIFSPNQITDPRANPRAAPTATPLQTPARR
ncbi:MAG TPA: hypothetical protein VGC85_01685 [Chthoniobacterales bacterium]